VSGDHPQARQGRGGKDAHLQADASRPVPGRLGCEHGSIHEGVGRGPRVRSLQAARVDHQGGPRRRAASRPCAATCAEVCWPEC
ncbi:unnamed protein product, partial [Prorocentrum cordatum]